MKIPSILFALGLLVAIVAFFDFPLPYIADKWLLVIIGAVIAFFSYTLINENRRGDPKQTIPAGTRAENEQSTTHDKTVS